MRPKWWNYDKRMGAASCLGLAVVFAALSRLAVPAAAGPAAAPPPQPYTVYVPHIGAQEPGFDLLLPLYSSGPSSPATAQYAAQGRSGGFITRSGEQLMLDGQPYRFVGTNVSYLAGPFFPEDKMEEVISTLSAAGVQVIRVWVQPWCSQDRVERMLDLGGKYDIHFILTLQDFYGNEDGYWFKGKYETIDLPHIRSIVPRFADRPEVLMWELMNEPVCPAKDSGQDCWDALYHWVQVTSQEVKRLDPNHLVSVGTQRAGFTEGAVDSFRRVHALDTIDAVSLHAEVGKDPRHEFGAELAIAHELGKPVYFGEVYMRGLRENCTPLPDEALGQRAQAVAADIERSCEAGIDGYLLWEYAYGGVDMGDHTQYFCSVFDYFANDPVWKVIEAARSPAK